MPRPAWAKSDSVCDAGGHRHVSTDNGCCDDTAGTGVSGASAGSVGRRVTVTATTTAALPTGAEASPSAVVEEARSAAASAARRPRRPRATSGTCADEAAADGGLVYACADPAAVPARPRLEEAAVVPALPSVRTRASCRPPRRSTDAIPPPLVAPMGGERAPRRLSSEDVNGASSLSATTLPLLASSEDGANMAACVGDGGAVEGALATLVPSPTRGTAAADASSSSEGSCSSAVKLPASRASSCVAAGVLGATTGTERRRLVAGGAVPWRASRRPRAPNGETATAPLADTLAVAAGRAAGATAIPVVLASRRRSGEGRGTTTDTAEAPSSCDDVDSSSSL